MAENEMFDSAVRSAGNQAGVFEYDGETGYFYLYETKGHQGQKVRAATHVLTGTPDFEEGDIAIRWDPAETIVGLFIHGHLWAAFDGRTGAKYGGDYRPNARPEIRVEITHYFES